MRLGIGSDHAGFDLSRSLAQRCRDLGHEVIEVGAMSEEPYDYPDAADALAPMILNGSVELGVLVCGTGIGISIRANRHPGIRAAVCCTPESAELARRHNHANVLCLGGRTLTREQALDILAAFLATDTDRDERHLRRIMKLDRSDDGQRPA